MENDKLESVLNRIASALERLADRYAPAERKEHKAATLGTACFSEEERSRLKLKDELKRKRANP